MCELIESEEGREETENDDDDDDDNRNCFLQIKHKLFVFDGK